MTIDTRYIPAFSIEDVLLDKDTGAPLSGGLVYFWKDNQRGEAKPVYQITGNSPDYTFIELPNPMTLSSIGTFEDSLGNPVIPYFLPWVGDTNEAEYYFVEVFSSGNVPQFTRESVPYIPDSFEPDDVVNNFQNELTNPQFSDILFENPTTFNFSGATLEAVTIAPGWDLVVTGTGSVTLSQITPQGTLNRPSNPGTILEISSSGITALRLRQRLQGIPALFAGTNLSGTFLAQTSGSTVTVKMYYLASNGMPDPGVQIVSASVDTTYAMKYDTGFVPASASTQSYPDAYVDIYLDLPTSVQLQISSVQLVCTNDASVEIVPFDQSSIERQVNGLYWFDKNPLEFKPMPSLLTAWDFALNPAQELGHTVTVTSTPAYAWDQLIMASVGGNVNVYQDPNLDWLAVDTVANSQAFYCMQYLDGGLVKKMLGSSLSSMFTGYRTLGTDVTARIYLFRADSGTPIPNLGVGTIGTLAANGVFTPTVGGWTEIPRSNLGQVVFTVPELTVITDLNTNDYDIPFSGWRITDIAQLNDTDKFCIVVTFSVPTAMTQLKIASISLNLGDIATRPASQTPDEVLRECQYLFEKSYNVETPSTPVPSTIVNAFTAQQLKSISGGNDIVLARQFYLPFKQTKRVTPAISFRDTNGNLAQVTAYLFQSGNTTPVATAFPADTNWTGFGEGLDGVTFRANGTATLVSAATAGTNGEGTIALHYVLNARYGQV